MPLSFPYRLPEAIEPRRGVSPQLGVRRYLCLEEVLVVGGIGVAGFLVADAEDSVYLRVLRVGVRIVVQVPERLLTSVSLKIAHAEEIMGIDVLWEQRQGLG